MPDGHVTMYTPMKPNRRSHHAWQPHERQHNQTTHNLKRQGDVATGVAPKAKHNAKDHTRYWAADLGTYLHLKMKGNTPTSMEPYQPEPELPEAERGYCKS
jgi:hypothetical protein